jgi:hypothetical protein
MRPDEMRRGVSAKAEASAKSFIFSTAPLFSEQEELEITGPFFFPAVVIRFFDKV